MKKDKLSLKSISLDIREKMDGLNMKQRAIFVFLIIYMAICAMVTNTSYLVKKEMEMLAKTENMQTYSPVVSEESLKNKNVYSNKD